MAYGISRGQPQPYGVSFHKGKTNFALFSKNAKNVSLILFDKDKQSAEKITFDPVFNKTGDIWHIAISHPPFPFYAYEIDGLRISDPFAKAITSDQEWANGLAYDPLGVIAPHRDFDWGHDAPPRIPLSDLIIYEMHTRGFTYHPSSSVDNKGTFLGVVEKIPHLKDLGVNAIELMPVHEFNEQEYAGTNPLTNERLFNYWGYSTVNFFSAMNRYGSIIDFKKMVKALHVHGIEIYLDVVFNHSAEGNKKGPIYSLKGIDNSIYYMLDEENDYLNFSGCGNTINCNHPVVIEMILASLRYWVVEMHVDGFRFDLASVFNRDGNGAFLNPSPLVEAISHDPILAHVKLIAEPWDAGGLYRVGSFYPHEARWLEWNDKYRDTVRSFIKGNTHFRKAFATRICGSQDLYGSQSPLSSVNFVVSHDGFSLADLVSYNYKHNLANGENNQDGSGFNESWNCGVEGETIDPKILNLRKKQMKNLIFTLLVSQGVPMLFMGDEYGHTKRGNNNTWCQDNELNWFLWDRLKINDGFYRFYKNMVNFRKSNPLLRQSRFLTDKDIHWHGTNLLDPNWEENSGFLALTLLENELPKIYIAFNAQNKSSKASLPEGIWELVVDTSKESPHDFSDQDAREPVCEKITLQPFSAVLLVLI